MFICSIGLVALFLIFLGNKNWQYEESTPAEKFTEVSSVLWKAHIYKNEIQFVSGNRKIHAIYLNPGDIHIHSVSYRNLYGYFDPVLVTSWENGGMHKALIIDPAVGQVLFETTSPSEIDIYIAQENKIVFETQPDSDSDNSASGDQLKIWPE